MKALKSAFDAKVLRNPDNVEAIRHIMLHAGYGRDQAVTVQLVPLDKRGEREAPVTVIAYNVPAAR